MLSSTSPSPRVYLQVPYAEKEEAKRHGARWNPERKLWWVDRRKIAEHPGIARWVNDNPGLVAKAKAAEDFLAGHVPLLLPATRTKSKTSPPRSKPPRFTRQTTFLLPDCSCSTPPWEDCEHTKTSSRGADDQEVTLPRSTSS